MTKKTLISLLIYSFCAWQAYAEAAQMEELINLGRLPITRVSASSNNGGFFQVRDAFEGDVPFRNGNCCPAWIAKPHEENDLNEWVNIRFLDPVTAYRIKIIGESSVIEDGAPARLTVKTALLIVTSLEKDKKEQITEIGPIEFKSDTLEISLPQPITDVKNVKINFLAATTGPITVREIQILGIAPGTQSNTSVTPRIDGAIPETLWYDPNVITHYDPPKDLPLRRFMISDSEAFIIDNQNIIVKHFPFKEQIDKTPLEGNFLVEKWYTSADISKDKKHLLFKKHIWSFEEERSPELPNGPTEYFELGEPNDMHAAVYDLNGNIVFTKKIHYPIPYERYCVHTSSASIDVLACDNKD